ncbi:hypothetical protein Tco_1004692 [Tanacetum coccineum]|uniref:Uncharacterized protein n=1 Tax=Tanacetum coccineum TaxID=301880 RepID=A0ABQ5FDR0_9ASTR
MEPSSLNSEEKELQQMQLDERELHQKCLTLLEKLKIHLESLHNSFHYMKTRSFEIAFRIFFLEDLESMFITEGAVMEACLVNKGRALDDNLVIKETTDDTVTSLEQLDESSSSMNENRSSDKDISNSMNECSRPGNENRSSDHKSTSSGNDADTDIDPSYDSDIVTEEEHDDGAYKQQRAFFASLINNLKCDVENCNEVNREAQQANALLTNELERYKQKENHFAKDMTIESEYCKNIKLLNDEISNLKSQACEKDKTFAKENEKYDDKQRRSPLSYHGFVYAETQFEEPPKVHLKRKNVNLNKHLKQLEQAEVLKNFLEQAQLRDHDPKHWNSLPMKYSCYVKQAVIKFEKQTFSKLQLSQDNKLNFEQSYEHNVNTRVRNRLIDEFEPLVKNVNLQLNCFEKSLVKEMKDNLKYVMSLEDEFDEKCLILDIQQEFFKTQFESVKSESYSHVYENRDCF